MTQDQLPNSVMEEIGWVVMTLKTCQKQVPPNTTLWTEITHYINMLEHRSVQDISSMPSSEISFYTTEVLRIQSMIHTQDTSRGRSQ